MADRRDITRTVAGIRRSHSQTGRKAPPPPPPEPLLELPEPPLVEPVSPEYLTVILAIDAGGAPVQVTM